MRVFIGWIFSVLLLSSCAFVGFHDSARHDPDAARALINDIKSDTILVVYPTFYAKEKIWKSALKTNVKSESYLTKELENLKVEQHYYRKSIKEAFQNNFTYCKYLLIPDSLITSFEDGENRAFFLGENGKIDPTIKLKNRSPVKFLRRDDTKWDLRIGNELLPNPFPNHVNYRNGLLELLGIEDFSDIITKIVAALQLRFDKFEANPNTTVRY